jgi:hypothetical protein
LATLKGESVDRPAVCFYEIGGFTVDPKDPDPFNIYNSPDWQPLLQLAREKTDIVRMASPRMTPAADNCASEFYTHEHYVENDSIYDRTTIKVGGRTLTSLNRRDKDIHTTWAVEHLLKDVDDLKAFLQIPDEAFSYNADPSNLAEIDRSLGDSGILMLETADPLCIAASLFSMADYTVIALTEQELFHRLLEKFSHNIYKTIETTAREYPGQLWRIAGPEYASEPYLPPYLFDEYVVRYVTPMIDCIQKYGGFARVHCHGRISKILPKLVEMGATATDPVEPPPQGDVELADVRRDYGRDLVLFGNLEVSDIENMAPAEFEKVVAKSLKDGTRGQGRGFVLQPSASPYGRTITPTTMANYETMVRLTESFS